MVEVRRPNGRARSRHTNPHLDDGLSAVGPLGRPFAIRKQHSSRRRGGGRGDLERSAQWRKRSGSLQQPDITRPTRSSSAETKCCRSTTSISSCAKQRAKNTYAGGRNAFDGHALVAGPYLALGGAIESPPAGTLDKQICRPRRFDRRAVATRDVWR